MDVRVEDFDYVLPEGYIANEPASPRDAARMMIVDRVNGTTTHSTFHDLTHILTENDVLVINQSKVFPARLLGRKETGGKAEVLLLRDNQEGVWEALASPGLEKDIPLWFSDKLTALVIEGSNDEGLVRLKFSLVGERLQRMIDLIGKVPLPPYIHSNLSENKLRLEYQTVYANEWGSAAAPTAGMHFTRASLKKLADEGVGIVPITLHVGLGTFQPVTEAQVKTGVLHEEQFCITRQTAEKIMEAKRKGKRVVAVGTTAARALESAASAMDGELAIKTDWQETNLFIQPGYKFKVVDSLITNFHLPKSSLLMLVTAFGAEPNTTRPFTTFDKSLMGEVYKTAVKEHYRFFSFGDCMWIQ